VRAARLWPLKRLDALRKRAERKGADVLEVEPARGGGLHGPYRYLLQKEGGEDEEQADGG